MDERIPTNDAIQVTADLIAAYVSANPVGASDLPGLISSVYAAISGLSAPAAEPEESKPVPPVPIKKSVTSEYIVSLEDGRGYKSLKRHLKVRGLTPDEYRAKWGLPDDYPMVAPNYAAQRSELAKAMGLGRKGAAARTAAAAQTRPRGRRKVA
jgi:predicted transcriptional regulator